MAKDEFEDESPAFQYGPDGTEETKYQNRDKVQWDFNPSEYGVGHGQLGMNTDPNDDPINKGIGMQKKDG